MSHLLRILATDTRPIRLAALVVILVLLLAGCGNGSGGGLPAY
ncbi:MAG: hypothetical protein ACRDGL_02440 [Candidatus Limnocylindrales bacterium]